MATATIGGALKAYLEAQGLGILVYKEVPPKTVRNAAGKIVAPYCTYFEDIVPMRMQPMEDGGPANGAPSKVTQTFQLDLWENWRDATNDSNLEGATLADAITRALHGAKLLLSGAGAPPVHVSAVRQVGRIRMTERDARIVHHAYTLAIDRDI